MNSQCLESGLYQLVWQNVFRVQIRDASILGIGSDPVIFCGSGIGQTRPIQIRSCAFKLIIFCVVIKPHGSHKYTIKHHTVCMHYISSVLKLFHSLIWGTDEYLSVKFKSTWTSLSAAAVCHPQFSIQTARRVRLLQPNSSRAHSYWGLKLFKEKAPSKLTHKLNTLRSNISSPCNFLLYADSEGCAACVLWLRVSRASFCARDAHCATVLSISFYNTSAQWKIVIVFLVLSYL